MKEFKIFKKHFVWTRTRIINYTILGVFALFYCIVEILKSDNTIFLNIIIWAFLFLYISGIVLKIANLNAIPQLKGSLVGSLVFAEDYIEINNISVPLYQIKKIKIEAEDWVGSEGNSFFLDFDYENGLSNGTDNYLKIIYSNNQTQKIRFQRKKACEFKEMEQLIRLYYIQDKIDYLNCIDILCLTSPSDWNEFKELKKYSN